MQSRATEELNVSQGVLLSLEFLLSNRMEDHNLLNGGSCGVDTVLSGCS